MGRMPVRDGRAGTRPVQTADRPPALLSLPPCDGPVALPCRAAGPIPGPVLCLQCQAGSRAGPVLMPSPATGSALTIRPADDVRGSSALRRRRVSRVHAMEQQRRKGYGLCILSASVKGERPLSGLHGLRPQPVVIGARGCGLSGIRPFMAGDQALSGSSCPKTRSVPVSRHCCSRAWTASRP